MPRVTDPGPLRTFTAAGSVIVMIGNTVTHAALAQILAPAAGFVFER